MKSHFLLTLRRLKIDVRRHFNILFPSSKEMAGMQSALETTGLDYSQATAKV